MTTTRRLAAILAADVAGYSRLMAADEVGTLEALKACRREVFDPAITGHRGRIVKTTGDGMLVEFASAVDAVTCAMAVQDAMAGYGGELTFRIGINVGDIIIEGDDIFGDGVNVAARVENECTPGGVCLSDDAFRQVRSKTSFAFDDLGERALKNIDRPVRIYAARVNDASTAGIASVSFPDPGKPLPLPDKPSIAVLPFQNMSGDPEQEYFADGMVEDIITALSRFKSLFVIARNSSFTYKGKAVDIKQVGRELGVRYLLEGSVRKAGGRVRITGQLIEAATGAHLWADRFERSLEDVFELQDEVTNAVVGALDPVLLAAEIARVKRERRTNLDAYDCFLRASDYVHQWSDDATESARQLFYRAIELDPDFAQAYANVSWCYVWRTMTRGRLGLDEQREAERVARAAARLGKDDGFCLAWAGHSLQFNLGEVKEGAALINQALELNINLARIWSLSGWSHIWLGQPEIAIDHLQRAMRLSPRDFAFHAMEHATANAHFIAGRYAEASLWATRSLHREPREFGAACTLVISKAAAGELEGARSAAQRLLQIAPSMRISVITSLPVLINAEYRAHYAELLRRSGVPE